MPLRAPGLTARGHATLIRIAVILLSAQGVVKDHGIGPRQLGAQSPPIWKTWSLEAHRTAGRAKWKVDPWSAFSVAQSRPPCASMMERLIDSPMPMPSGLVV